MSHTPVLPYVRKSCAFFLSQQLLRPQGVRGFCAAMFGESVALNEDAPMEKLDHMARVLTTVPATMKPQVNIVAISFLSSHIGYRNISVQSFLG